MKLGQYVLVAIIQAYRLIISPAKLFLLGLLGKCRFTPTCSEYALAAIREHGALRGSWLALKRLGRCHPWGGCGEDPVPHRISSPPGKGCAGHASDSSPSGSFGASVTRC